MSAFDHTIHFANLWTSTFPGTQCPVLPKKPEELGLSARMALESDNPILFQNLFGGTGSTNLPADTVMRRNSGQLQGSDVFRLGQLVLVRAAQQLEQQPHQQMDQRMAGQALSSRENYKEAMARSKAWSESRILARMGHTPIDPALSANRRKWGSRSLDLLYGSQRSPQA